MRCSSLLTSWSKSSPPTPRDERRDRVEKMADYAQFGVRGYWLVDPALGSFEIFDLDESRRYLRAAVRTEGGARVVDYGALLLRARAVYDRIDAYRRYFDRHQHKLAIFAATYVKSTQGVLEALQSDAKKPPGERFFRDPAFIVELTERFSHRYFVAMHRIARESKTLPMDDAPPATRPRTDEPGCDPWRKMDTRAAKQKSTTSNDLTPCSRTASMRFKRTSSSGTTEARG
ncbi:MAG: DUF5995 family protein [Myxococcota bacterium]